MKKLPLLLLHIILGCVFTASANAQVKQTREVIEAYQGCSQFQHLLAENFDFARAFEATFTKNAARRRAIAITEGEFGNAENLKGISDTVLINAYKQRMQIFFLMLALINSKDKVQPDLLSSPEIEKIFKRAVPQNKSELSKYFVQLSRDVSDFREYFDSLVKKYPAVAEGVNKFKSELLASKIVPPTDYKILPKRGYYRSNVVNAKQEYYEIDGYVLIKEQGKMRIVGIRLFTRLF